PRASSSAARSAAALVRWPGYSATHRRTSTGDFIKNEKTSKTLILNMYSFQQTRNTLSHGDFGTKNLVQVVKFLPATV
ncbi:hypothetical protein, partial [Shinella kummerowiae]|uniref:hypothetical protein n=1 Tax=Shinella kummerowiae TaxID=417745 RepID=UPI0021B5A813